MACEMGPERGQSVSGSRGMYPAWALSNNQPKPLSIAPIARISDAITTICRPLPLPFFVFLESAK